MKIQRAQRESFRRQALRRFHDELIADIRECFPGHFSALGETTLRAVITYGIERAERYGIVNERAVSQYVNCMLMLGGKFDEDLLLPWVSEILRSPIPLDPDDRMDDLSLAALSYLDRVAGIDNFTINRSIVTLRRDLELWLRQSSSASFRDSLELGFGNFFPTKLRELSRTLLDRFVVSVPAAARRYGLYSGQNLRLYGMMMFMLGSSFDVDPGLPWVKQALAEEEPVVEAIKFERLLRGGLTFLDHFCNRPV